MSASAMVDWRSLTALLLEWTVIALMIGSALVLGLWWAVVIAFVVVATRQHALLILYHDAVHGHLARDGRINDLIVNFAVGVPALMPVEVYRPLHIDHHRSVGTDRDPERQLLFAGQLWNYRPLPMRRLTRQILGDMLVVNGVRTIVAWRQGRPMPRLHRQTCIIAAIWLTAMTTWLALAPEPALVALGLWLGPLLTLTQLLQKLRSYAEHSGGPGVTPGWDDWTYSWRAGPLGRLTIWPYHINYHREHHEQPQLHWHQLPGAGAGKRWLPGNGFWKLLGLSAAPPAPD